MRGPRLLLGVLVLTAFTVTALDARAGGSPLDSARRGADTVFGPAQRVVGGAADRAAGALAGLGSTGADRATARRLQQDNDDLRRRLLQMQGLEATGAQLADLMKQKDEGTYTTVLARVVGYGSFQPFDSTLTVDAGSRDGLRPGQTVTSGRGLVGRTVRVGPDTSVVALLTDPTFGVGTRLNRAPQSFGLTSGTGRGPMRFELVDLAEDGGLRIGDDLVTAGSDTFAPGVPVGRVTRVAPRSSGTVPSADVQPYADLGALDLLQVITEGPRSTPRVAIPPAPPPPPPAPAPTAAPAAAVVPAPARPAGTAR